MAAVAADRQRRSGRGWRLRRRSMQLLQHWQEQLQLPIQRGLLLLASETQEWERQQRLVQQSHCLKLLSPADLTEQVNQAARDNGHPLLCEVEPSQDESEGD